MKNLLEIKGLTLKLMSVWGVVYALCGVDLNILSGQIHGVVGESGCGKSMTAKSILRLLDPKRSKMTGSIRFEGRELMDMSNKELEKLRGSEISMIFQDPTVSLNPVMTVGEQIADMYRWHMGAGKKEALKKAEEMLSKVGIEPAHVRCRQYPFELSGGMQQRVMIAMAIACSPKLLIADEPTTSLDVTIQAQILELLRNVSKDMGMSVLLITHDFAVVAQSCDRVSVMYAGKVVETGKTKEILKHAAHPYSKALISSIPSENKRGERLKTIPKSPPSLFEPATHCMFAPRCPYADKRCFNACPELTDYGGGHFTACFKPLESEMNLSV